MFNVKRWIIIITVLLLVFGIAGCSKKIPDQLIPDQLSDELEKISGFRIGFITLVDSDTGQIEFLKNSKVEAESAKFPQPASEIRKITSVSVVGVSGIKIGDTSYNFCSYISFDDHRELICANNEHQEYQSSQNIPDISADLAMKLGKAGEINNIGFLVLTDFITGQTKLLKNKDYISLPANLPQSISAIKSSSSWSMISFKKNPCYKLVDRGGGNWKLLFYPYKNC